MKSIFDNVRFGLYTHMYRLQPLDLSMNKAAKEHMHSKFQDWYADKVMQQIDKNEDFEPIDLRLSRMKPLGAQWAISLYNLLG